MKKKIKYQVRGFTLIEMMIVITLISILASLALPNYVKYRTQTHAAACYLNLVQITRAWENYVLENNLNYTIDTELSASQLSSGLVGPTNYLKAWSPCQAGGIYTLTVSGASGLMTAFCSHSGHSSVTASGR